MASSSGEFKDISSTLAATQKLLAQGFFKKVEFIIDGVQMGILLPEIPKGLFGAIKDKKDMEDIFLLAKALLLGQPWGRRLYVLDLPDNALSEINRLKLAKAIFSNLEKNKHPLANAYVNYTINCIAMLQAELQFKELEKEYGMPFGKVETLGEKAKLVRDNIEKMEKDLLKYKEHPETYMKANLIEADLTDLQILKSSIQKLLTLERSVHVIARSLCRVDAGIRMVRSTDALSVGSASSPESPPTPPSSGSDGDPDGNHPPSP